MSNAHHKYNISRSPWWYGRCSHHLQDDKCTTQYASSHETLLQKEL